MDIIQEVTKKYCKKNIPDLRPGDIVKVYQKITEGNKERLQVFEGIIIAVHAGKTLDASFTVRKISFGIGVERTFPLHSPTIIKIEKTKSIRVRRAKLYFLRDAVGKKAKKRQEFKEFTSWEEPMAKEEEEKVKAEQEAEAKAREEAKKKEQEELDKKFAQAQAAKQQSQEHQGTGAQEQGKTKKQGNEETKEQN